MNTFVEAGKVSEIKDGEMKEILVDGREILIARASGKYYSADARCPHMGGKLAMGKLEGTIVTCPRHGSQFDLADGHVVRWLKGSGVFSAVGKALKSPRSIVTYKVKVESDSIMVEI